MKLSRQQERQKRKQEKKVKKIVEAFIKKYKDAVNGAKTDLKDSKEENVERNLSDINMMYLEVWRGVLNHVKKEFALVGLDANYFDEHIIWK